MIITNRNISLVAMTLVAGLSQACGDRQGATVAAPGNGPTTVQAPNALATQVEGAPADGATVAASTLTLTFKVEGAELAAGQLTLQGFECKVGDDDAFKACGADGKSLVISSLKHGESYTLVVRGVLKNELTGTIVYAAERPLHFKVDLNTDPTQTTTTQTTTTGPAPLPGTPAAGAHALSNQLLVGSAYKVTVPEGLHVTEYSSTKTTGVLSFFRIANDSDPFYETNFTCNKSWDRMVASMAPTGELNTYCHSTPTREAYKNEFEYRLAHNHVEIATDTKLVTDSSQERLSVATYDADWEFVNVRSRFWNACQNSPESRKFITVPMINNFFLGKNPENVDFWYCDTYQKGLAGEPVLWRVGAFVDVDHMDWDCSDCKYGRALEAVYMVRANSAVFTPELFAKQAQTRIMSVLDKMTP